MIRDAGSMTDRLPEIVPDAVTGCLEACRRCDDVVAAVVGQAPHAFPSVGPHLRHCLEHFHLLLEGWRAGFVDYDARSRDLHFERDPQAVRGALRQIASSLAALRVDDLASELTVAQSAAPGRPPLSSSSFLERELVFLSGHTIHHIAIMVLAAAGAGVTIPQGLAVAYSTESHRESPALNR
jgi:hypothetical protein